MMIKHEAPMRMNASTRRTHPMLGPYVTDTVSSVILPQKPKLWPGSVRVRADGHRNAKIAGVAKVNKAETMKPSLSLYPFAVSPVRRKILNWIANASIVMNVITINSPSASCIPDERSAINVNPEGKSDVSEVA